MSINHILHGFSLPEETADCSLLKSKMFPDLYSQGIVNDP